MTRFCIKCHRHWITGNKDPTFICPDCEAKQLKRTAGHPVNVYPKGVTVTILAREFAVALIVGLSPLWLTVALSILH